MAVEQEKMLMTVAWMGARNCDGKVFLGGGVEKRKWNVGGCCFVVEASQVKSATTSLTWLLHLDTHSLSNQGKQRGFFVSGQSSS